MDYCCYCVACLALVPARDLVAPIAAMFQDELLDGEHEHRRRPCRLSGRQWMTRESAWLVGDSNSGGAFRAWNGALERSTGMLMQTDATMRASPSDRGRPAARRESGTRAGDTHTRG